MMKLADMRDLGDVTSVKDFRPIIRRAHSLVKAGPSCFYRCGSSVMLRLGPRRVKTEGNKIATGSSVAHMRVWRNWQTCRI